MDRIVPVTHPDAGHNTKQNTDVFPLTYWRCVLICESEGAVGGFGAVGHVWFPNCALKVATMVSTAWGKPDVSLRQRPGWEAVSHQAAPIHLSQPLPMWLLEHGKLPAWKAAPDYETPLRFPQAQFWGSEVEGDRERGRRADNLGSIQNSRDLQDISRIMLGSWKFGWAMKVTECGSARDSWGDFLAHDLAVSGVTLQMPDQTPINKYIQFSLNSDNSSLTSCLPNMTLLQHPFRSSLSYSFTVLFDSYKYKTFGFGPQMAALTDDLNASLLVSVPQSFLERSAPWKQMLLSRRPLCLLSFLFTFVFPHSLTSISEALLPFHGNLDMLKTGRAFLFTCL